MGHESFLGGSAASDCGEFVANPLAAADLERRRKQLIKQDIEAQKRFPSYCKNHEQHPNCPECDILGSCSASKVVLRKKK